LRHLAMLTTIKLHIFRREQFFIAKDYLQGVAVLGL
jgi:hypothetical protein